MERIAVFEDPVKGYQLELKVCNIDDIKIPKFQRDLSKTLVNHLMVSIEKMGFLVPVIICRAPDGDIYVVDGMHRIEALKALGYDKVLAIEVPEELYFQILDFNTEKPPTIRDKAKQAYRLYLSIIEDLGDEADSSLEVDFANKLQSPHFVTIGCLLEEINPKFPAGYWDDFIEKIDNFLEMPIRSAHEERKKRAIRLNQVNMTAMEAYEKYNINDPLSRQTVIRKAIHEVYGQRVRVIEDDYYTALDKIEEALSTIDFSFLSE